VARALVPLLLAAALVPGAQARDALGAIDDCIAKLDTDLDVGSARIAARCPDLTAALSQGPWAPWLPADWNRPDNQLSAGGLSELRTLLARENAPAVSRRPSPRPQRVAAALAAVTRPDDGGATWWQRFKDWVHTILTTRAETDEHWLGRWLAQINLSARTTELVVWGALAVVVALAAGIVLNELRLAGLLGGRERSERGGAAQLPKPGSALALEQIERAAPDEQPGLLLELIALRLAEQQRLPPARALTARELEQRARLPDESARLRLAQLVGVCERVRFSGQRLSAASLAGALGGGRLLLAALDAAAPAAPALVP
jgi:hypothetical protein